MEKRTISMLRFLGLMIAVCVLAGSALGQSTRDSTGTVAFTENVSNARVSQDSNPPITLELDQVPLKEALKRIAGQAEAGLYYNAALLPEKTVSLHLKAVPLGTALQKVLEGTMLQVVTSGRNITLRPESIPRQMQPPPANAQETITGTVTDGSTGNTLPGVNIKVKGTTTGTSTGPNGQYELSVESVQDTLVFSFVGYKTRQEPINGRTEIDIVMQSQAISGQEMVVVGYGEQEKENLTTAVSKVSGEEIEDRPVARVDQALVGKLAGVRVQEVSGRPGRPLSVKVRGTGSITAGTEPLYVIDGIPVSDINNIAVGDVESIQVLKDAAAAAIYGSRGSNGVVIITTKKGHMEKPVVSIKSQTGFQESSDTYPVLDRDEWIDFAVDERTNTYLLNGGDPDVPVDERTGFSRINPKWISNPESFPDTDWQDLILRKAPLQNQQLSISGSTDKINYYLYGNLYREMGVVKNSDYNRYSFRARIETQVSDKIKIGLNINPNISMRNDPVTESIFGPVTRSTKVAPIVKKTQQTQQGGYNPYVASFFLNPVTLSEEIKNETRSFRNLSSLFGEFELIGGLSLKSSVALDYIDQKVNFFRTNNINRGRGSVAHSSTSLSYNFLNENTLHYKGNFGRHSFTALAGFTVQQIHDEGTYGAVTGFPNDQVKTLNAGTVLQGASSTITRERLISYLARITYSYDGRYLFTASIRRDGSSKFGSNNRYGVFPSASIGWRISNEQFMRDLSAISNLKLRVSYGLTGNNSIPNFGSLALLNQANYVLGQGLGGKVVGLRPSSLANPDLGWERTKSLNAGIDLGLFNDRIALNVNFYRKQTGDLLLNVPIPQITGFSSTLKNIGEVENKGIEIELNSGVISTKNFSWNLQANLSHNKNTVKKLGPNDSPIAGYARGFNISKTRVGGPIGSYYLIPVEGIFMSEEELNNSALSKEQHVGDLKYSDINGDGTINSKDQTLVGHNNPDYIWGLSQTVNYRNVDLSATLQGEWGNNLVNITQSAAGQSRGNVLSYWKNRWRSPENPGDGKTPRAAVTANLQTPSTFWMYDASYIKLQNITLGYTFPQHIFGNILRKARIYVTIDNVFTIDDYYGNPQTGTLSNSPLTPGIDGTNTYPIARKYMLGINFTF